MRGRTRGQLQCYNLQHIQGDTKYITEIQKLTRKIILSTLCLILYVSEAVEIELQVTASQETTDKLTQIEQHGGQCYQ